MKPRLRDSLCIAVTLAALCAGAANKLRMGAPPDASDDLKRIRAAAEKSLGHVPGLTVQQGSLPRQAFELLRPNVLESRLYHDPSSDLSFTVLLVHCGDVNDMGAHYPPACYPGSGLLVTETRSLPLGVSDLNLNGVEYRLDPSRLDQRGSLYIWNCMFLPGGESTYSPGDLRARTRTGNLRYYGSGQIQVLVSASLREDRRVAIYQEALRIYEPVIRAMLSDPRPAPNPREVSVHE